MDDGSIAVNGYGGNGSYQYYGLLKLNESGYSVWSKVLSSGYPLANSTTPMIGTVEGGLASAGHLRASDGSNFYNFLLLKFNNTGGLEWNESYGLPNIHESANGLIQTADNGYAMIGTSLNYSGTNDIYFVRTNSSGIKLWDKYIDSGYVDGGNSLVESQDGGFLLTGTTRDLSGNDDLWILKLNATGDLQWNRSLSVPNFSMLPGSLINVSDGYVIGGVAYSKTQVHQQVWVMKFDFNGNQIWNTTFGNSQSNDFFGGMVQTSDLGFAVLARSSDNPIGQGIWLIKLNSTGQIVWDSKYAGLAAEAIKEYQDGGLIIAGSGTIPGTDESDIWVMKTTSSGSPIWQSFITSFDEMYYKGTTSSNTVISGGTYYSYNTGTQTSSTVISSNTFDTATTTTITVTTTTGLPTTSSSSTVHTPQNPLDPNKFALLITFAIILSAKQYSRKRIGK